MIKCFHVTCKSFIYVFVLLLLLFFSSCGILRRRTITVTETITKIDTIIKVVYDTAIVIKEAKITDTVIIENKTVIARSYYNPVKNKIVMEVKGKIFDVPVQITQHRIETKKDFQPKNNWYLIIIAEVLIILFLMLLIKLLDYGKKK